MAPEFGETIRLLPLIPQHVLKKHKIDAPLDNRFRSAARLLQSIWRRDRNLPIGDYIGEDGKRHKLGSRITPAAGATGANFITPEIAMIAWREAAYREYGALIDEERLFTNLLSSMPLTFNLFAPWRQDAELARAMLIHLIPDFVGTVQQVLFEHAPARGNVRFTGDYSAFDCIARYLTSDGKKGFVAFEVKFSEPMDEPTKPLKPRYDELAENSCLFVEPGDPALRANPLQQLFREHLLAQSMIENGLYAEGHFVLIAPELNHPAQNAAVAYAEHLREPGEGRITFQNVTLEKIVDAFREAGQAEHAAALHRRYLDFWLVDGELELNAPTPKKASPSDRKGAETAKTRRVPNSTSQVSATD
jgi:hypothetical protein